MGAAFILRGRLVGAELFDSPRTFAQLLPKLVRSYGLDALDHSLPRESAAEVRKGLAVYGRRVSTALVLCAYAATGVGKVAATPCPAIPAQNPSLC